jgi:hypothetical protein
MAVHVTINTDGQAGRHTLGEHAERERRLQLTARRRRLARIRRHAETAAWVVGLLILTGLAAGGLAGLR